MSAISLKSITGITSITTPAGVDNQLTLHTNNTTERLKIDVAGNVHVNNHLSIAGVTTHQDDVAIRSSNPLILSNAANNASCQVLCDGGARLHFKSYNQTMATFENGVAITFYTDSGQNRLQINNNGNVFIAKDLDVDGHTNLDNVSVAGVTTFSNNVKFDGATAGRDVTFIRSSNTLEFATNAILELGNGGSGDCRLFNNGTDTRIINGDGTLKFESDTHEFRDKDNTTSYLTITSAGKVLVGDGSSITPSRHLDVRGTGHQQILIGSTNNSGASLMLDGHGGGDGSGGNYGTVEMGSDGHLDIRNYDTAKSIIFGTGSATGSNDVVTIDSSGALLVNRTAKYASSSEKLSVNGMTSIQGSSTSAAPLYVFNTETTADGTVQPFFFLHDGNGIRGGLGLQRSTSNFIINANNVIQFRAGASGVGGSEIARIDAAGLRVNKTTTSDYGKFEVKGGTADNIETSDITAKTVATFSGSTPGTTAAGKGVGIVIKPISNRGCNYFFGVAGDSANQESHGRFIIRSGNFAGTTSERLRINSSGHITPGSNNSQNIGDGTTNFASIWASTRFRGNDDVKLVLGNSQDLVVRHSGGVNYIESPQGGSLHIKSGVSDNANLKHIQCDYNGNTIIYHQNGGSAAERIKTTNNGIEFGGEVNFTSGNNVRTFVGSFTLSDGQHADIVQNNSGYTWGFFEFYCLSYHGSIGRARWVGAMSRYSNNDNYPTINNSMGYTDLQRVATGSPSGQVNMIRVQRTGTYGNVTYNLYVRCIAPNSVPNWSGAGYGTLKYDGN